MKLRNDFIRFIFVGCCSTAIDFCIYLCLSRYLGISISKCISMTAACVFSFFINKQWTFKDKTGINVSKVVKYILAQIINICINTGINTAIYNMFHKKVMAFLFATGVATIANYLLQKNMVFTRKKEQ